MTWIVAAVAALIFILFLYKGFKNGFVISALGVAAFIASYYLSYILAHPAGLLIHHATGIYRFVAVPAGGIVIFIAVNCFGTILKFIYKKVKRTRSESEDGKVVYFYKPSLSSSLAGTCLMMPIAIFIVSFIFWTASAVQPDKIGVVGTLISWPAKLCVAHGFNTILDDENGVCDAQIMSELIANPTEAVERINSVVNDPQVKSLITDQNLMMAIKSSDPERIANSEALNRLLMNDDAMEKLYRVGLTPEDYTSNEYKQELSVRLSRVGERINVLENDPEFQQIIEEMKSNGGFSQSQIRSLLTDRKFLGVVDKILYETR